MSVKNLPIPYKYAILAALGFSLLLGLKNYLSYYYWGELEYFKWPRHVWLHIVNYTFWGVLSPIVYYFSQRFKLKKGASLSTKAKAILASILLAAFHETITNFIFYTPLHLGGILEFTSKQLQFLVKGFPIAFSDRLMEYWIVYGILIAFDNQRKFQQKQLELVQVETQLANAQLNALRLQLNPHFLFNTLNTISSLMVIDIKAGQRMVSKLGNLLRTVLDTNKRNIVPLKEEIAFIQDYLGIEQVRFQDRLQLKYEIDDTATQALVPSLLLQPLVENAIKHGFATQPDQGTITLNIKHEDDRIRIKLQDDGTGSAKSISEIFDTGIGLKNVKDRLTLLYGDNYLLNIQTQPGHGFAVLIDIPYQNEEE